MVACLLVDILALIVTVLFVLYSFSIFNSFYEVMMGIISGLRLFLEFYLLGFVSRVGNYLVVVLGTYFFLLLYLI